MKKKKPTDQERKKTLLAKRENLLTKRERERHTIVFTGFPAKSRKKLVIDYVEQQLGVVQRLAGYADDAVLKDKVFAPSIRTNIAMLRLPSKKAMFEFLSAWNLAEETGQLTRFGENELMIRAKRDKPPAVRKAHGKLWQLSTYFKGLGFGDGRLTGGAALFGSKIAKRSSGIWTMMLQFGWNRKWQNIISRSMLQRRIWLYLVPETRDKI